MKKTHNSFMKADVVKVDAELGLVFGWGIVCKVDGEDYFDLQRDHIPEDAMLKATADFMAESRISGEMHARDAGGNPIQDGDVVFSFPLTTEIAKALEIETRKTGWLVAVRPSSTVLEKYKSGKYTGFSIGGSRVKDEDAEDAEDEEDLDKAGGGNPYHDEKGRFTTGDGAGSSSAVTGGSGRAKEIKTEIRRIQREMYSEGYDPDTWRVPEKFKSRKNKVNRLFRELRSLGESEFFGDA